MATKTVSIRVEEELIDRLKERSEKNASGSFNCEIASMIPELMELEMWGRLNIENIFTKEELAQITRPPKTMRFVKEAFCGNAPQEIKDKILSLTPLQCWSLWCAL